MMITYDEAAVKAARLLKTSEEEMRANSEVLPDGRGYRFWQPMRGGGAILMDPEGGVLFVNSSVNEDEHLRLFLRGKRTPEELFD